VLHRPYALSWLVMTLALAALAAMTGLRRRRKAVALTRSQNIPDRDS
jgi:hypothetical protein